MQEANNFIHNAGDQAIAKFRKRVLQSILSTDLTKHSAILKYFQSRIDFVGIQAKLNNGNLYIDDTSAQSRFDT
jgi:hypothetical protein